MTHFIAISVIPFPQIQPNNTEKKKKQFKFHACLHLQFCTLETNVPKQALASNKLFAAYTYHETSWILIS